MIPAKSEVTSALARLGKACMEPVHTARKGAVFKSTHAKLDENEESICHDIHVVKSYVSSLERKIDALESVHRDPEDSMEELSEIDMENASCACKG